MATIYDEERLSEQNVETPEGKNLIRASLFNLIVLSQDPERAAYCEKLIQVITQKFPCKIIYVRAESQGQSDFVRTTSSIQVVGSGSNKVLCDQITIEATKSQFSKIPFLILPEIQPDLPVYILLSHDPVHDQVILPQLQRYATRVLFDSESVDNIYDFSQRMLRLIEMAHTDFIDLNWTRTKAWRDAIAKAFNTAETLNELKKSKTIQISYVSSPYPTKMHCEMQAVFLQAWLAAKLNWKLISIQREEGFLRIAYKYENISLTVSLTAKDTALLEPGAIFAFEALTEGDYHFLISHEGDSKLVKVHASNPDRCEMPFTIFLSNFQNGPALVNEIFYQPLGHHYEAMLKMLASPLWQQCSL